jgi:thiosulfate reductase cytochrome b subunit
VVLAGGAAYSALRTRRLRLPSNLTLGNILILAGAVVVAAIASLTRLGYYELFYASQLVGVAIIFAGFRVIAASPQSRSQPA